MKLNRINLFAFLAAFLIIVDLLVALDLNAFYIRAVLAFLFITIVPGLLIMLIMKIREVGFWEYLVYTVGLSISFIMFGGLAVNWILPWLNITDKPLSLWPILISFNIFLLIMGFFAYKRNKDLNFEPVFPKLDLINNIFFIIPMFFPVMAILGAFILNNNGPNTITMIMLGGIAVYVLALVIFRKRLNENVYPWALILVSFSLMLMITMRGWYLTGHDIFKEYYVFQLVKENSIWNIDSFRSSYNSCLSIGILPTIIHIFSKINDVYIFKIMFQLISPLLVLTLFLFIKRIYNSIFSLLSTILFISMPYFLLQTPIVERQEIALFFFNLLFLIIFDEKIKSHFKKTIFLVFSFSIIVSHYSTSYIAISLFTVGYISTFLYKKYEIWSIKKNKLGKFSDYHLSGILIILFLLFGFFWYSQLTETSTGLTNFLDNSVSNIKNLFNEEVLSKEQSPYSQLNPFYNSKKSVDSLNHYVNQTSKIYQKEMNISSYSEESYIDYNIRKIPQKIIPAKIKTSIVSKIYLFIEILKMLIKIFTILGVILLIIYRKKNKNIKIEQIVLGFIGLIFLFLAATLPLLSGGYYDISRAYQILLIILSLPAIIGASFIFWFIKKEYRATTVLSVFIIIFMFSSGFLGQIIGGSSGFLGLNNFGDNYDRFYTKKAEIVSINWLDSNYQNKKLPIYADIYASRKVFAFSNTRFNIREDILPAAIDKYSYVYLSYTNTVNFKASKEYRYINWDAGEYLSYNFPTSFLNNNKNLIYNNGGSKIFK